MDFIKNRTFFLNENITDVHKDFFSPDKLRLFYALKGITFPSPFYHPLLLCTNSQKHIYTILSH